MKLSLRWTVRVVWDGSDTSVADGSGYTPDGALASLRRQAEFKQQQRSSEAAKYGEALDLIDDIESASTTTPEASPES